jgi:hypothetical protein
MIAHGVYILTYNDADLVIHQSWERKGVLHFWLTTRKIDKFLAMQAKMD